METNRATNINTGKKQNRVATLIKLEPGEHFTGKYIGLTKRDWADNVYSVGDIKELITYVFSGGDGKRFMYRGDAGFNTAFESALVQMGEVITVVKGEKKDIGDDRYMNTYEIFEA